MRFTIFSFITATLLVVSTAYVPAERTYYAPPNRAQAERPFHPQAQDREPFTAGHVLAQRSFYRHLGNLEMQSK